MLFHFNQFKLKRFIESEIWRKLIPLNKHWALRVQRWMVWGESIVSFFMTSSNYHFRMSAPKGSFAWKLTNRGWRNITRATDSILSIFDKIAAEYIRCEWVVNNWFWIIDMHCDSCLHRRRRRRHHTNQSHVQFSYLLKNNISDSTYNNWQGGQNR